MSTVHVSNIAPSTTETELREFFSFCGKITSLSITPAATSDDGQSATVTFERETAAKTALLLDNTKLGPSNVKVEATSSLDEIAGNKATGHSADEVEREQELRQEDKPKTAILAEYLSHGYVIGDQALQRGIALDKQHGISARFTSTLNKALTTFDTKFHATDRARAVDSSYKVTDRAVNAQKSFYQYFEKALSTPTGMKVRQFYQVGEKQVLDIHNEAKRLADLRKQEAAAKEPGEPSYSPPSYTPAVGSSYEKQACTCEGGATAEGACTCPPGSCACAGCKANMMAAAASTSAADTVHEVAQGVAPSEKTAPVV